MAYRGYSPPPSRGERWDRERFDNHHRGPPVVERDRYEEVDYYSPPPRQRESERGPPRRVEERYYYDEKDRYEIPRRPRREPARYYDDEGSNYEGAMVPVRHRDEERDIEIDIRRREYDRHSPPRKPAFVRRQSSLDTFDRKPLPKYGDRMREEVIPIPTGSRRRSPPRYRSPPQFVERDYEEIRVAEPEYYGDEEFRGYREREISRVRTHRDRDYEIEEEREEIIETEFPKRGKTKMPMRLVDKQAIIQLGYPFEEEGETIIILKALGKEHIDEVIKVSREIKSRPAPAALEAPIEETRTTYVIEHPSAPPPPPTEEKVVERRTEIIRELPSSPGSPNPDAPRSVKEWDVLSRKTSRHDEISSHHSHRSPSPARSHHTRKSSRSHHHSRARSVSSSSTRRELIIAEDREESGTIRAGVGALVIPSSRDRRSDRDIKAEIRALEQERRALKLEREVERYRPEERERELIVVKERDDEVVEVRKDRKAPDPRIIRAMLKTLT